MFGWFRARSPLDPLTKAWLEDRLNWLAEEFGREVFLDAPTILPTHEFFPDEYDGSDESIQAMLNRVCRTMQVDPWRVRIELFKSRDPLGLVDDRGRYFPGDPAGTFDSDIDQFVVQLDVRQLGEPEHMVGTMAHELSHARLRGEHRIEPEIYDEELLTDLTAVFHGFGIFLSNSPRNWDSMYSTWPDSDLKKPEYMTLPMYGYALAHHAWHRGETHPPWLRHARPDVRAVFKESLRYLTETGDSAFKPRAS